MVDAWYVLEKQVAAVVSAGAQSIQLVEPHTLYCVFVSRRVAMCMCLRVQRLSLEEK